MQLTDEEWLGLSYRQFSLLHERHLALRRQDQWQRGAIASAVYRSGMRNFDPMPKPDDFIFTIVPGQKRHEAPKREKLPREEIASFFRSLAGKKQ